MPTKNARRNLRKPFTRLRKKSQKEPIALEKPLKVRTFSTIEELTNAESELGRTIFGPIPAGHQREFFRYKNNVWIWHENWREGLKNKSITIRYEVKKDGVYKKVNTSKTYRKIEGEELENFRKALHAYLKIVKTRLYR